jgi:hypothetical protein
VTEAEIDHWDYRVRGFTAFTGVPGADPEESHDIIEAYYDAEGNVVAWGNNIGAVGGTLDELRDELSLMLEACDKPVLDEDDLPRAEIPDA